MGYEIFTRKTQYRGSPGISLTRKGILAFNKGASTILQKEAVENVLLLWDKEKRMIGIRPIGKKDPRSYMVHMNKRGDGAGFSAATFLKHIEYKTSETRSFLAQWNELQQMFEIEVPEEYLKKDVLVTPTVINKGQHTTTMKTSKVEDMTSNEGCICKECGRTCKSPSGLHNHMRLAHPKVTNI